MAGFLRKNPPDVPPTGAISEGGKVGEETTPDSWIQRLRDGESGFTQTDIIGQVEKKLKKEHPLYPTLNLDKDGNKVSLTEILKEMLKTKEGEAKYEDVYNVDKPLTQVDYEKFKKEYSQSGSYCTHALIEIYFEQRALFESVVSKPREKLSTMWANVLESMKEKFSDNNRDWGFPQAQKMETFGKAKNRSDFGFFNTVSRGGFILSEQNILLGMVQYQNLENHTLRTRYSKMFNQMKEHLRKFFRPSYNMFQKLSWMFSSGVLRYLFGASIFVDTASNMLDTVVNGMTLGPAVVGNMIVNEFLGTVTKTVPTIGGSSIVVISAVFVAIAVVCEAYLIYTQKDYRLLLEYLLKEANKVIVHSSYEWSGNFRIIVRILEAFGVRRTGMIMEAMSTIQSPYDAFRAFEGLASYKSLDHVIKDSKSPGAVGSYINRMLKEFQGSRTIQRAATGFSVLGMNRRKNSRSSGG